MVELVQPFMDLYLMVRENVISMWLYDTYFDYISLGDAELFFLTVGFILSYVAIFVIAFKIIRWLFRF